MTPQDPALIAREGLPYWLFYLLLCLIFLLVAFIFLRDKELRIRLNEFLSGAKKRMKRTQMRIRLNRENKKKGDLLAELGKKAWTEKYIESRVDSHIRTLDHLDRQRAEKQAEMRDILARIIELRKKTADAGTAKAVPEDRAKASERHVRHALKIEERQARKDIRDNENKIQQGQEFLKAIEIRKREEFVRIGTLLDDARPEHRDFLGLFVQIDKLNRKILHYLNEIEKFR